MAQSSFTVDHVPGDKWNPERYSLELTDTKANTPIEGFDIESDRRGGFTVTLSLNAERFSGNQQTLHDRVRTLLDHEGVEQYEIQTSSHPRLSSVVIKNCIPGDMGKIAGALSSTVDLAHGVTTYGILPSKLAIDVADHERGILGSTTAFEVRKDNIWYQGVGGEGRDFVDFESHISGSAVTMVKQDSVFAESKAGEAIFVEQTNIVFDPKRRSDVTTVLQAAQQEFKISGENIIVLSPIHEVTKILADSGLIPQSAHFDIAAQFAQIRPSFSRHADVVNSQAVTRTAASLPPPSLN